MRISEDSLPRFEVHQRPRNESLVAELSSGFRPPRVRPTRGGLFLDPVSPPR